MKKFAFVGAGVAGAGLMYFLDPAYGRRRRALLFDKAVHGSKVAGRSVEITAQDLKHRVQGLMAKSKRSFGSPDVPDDTLAERVRSELGHVVSNPRSIYVGASNGRVVLIGPVLASEHTRLVSRIAKVPGVRSVTDELDTYEQSGSEPGLQGQGRTPRTAIKRHWTPTSRATAALTALGALLWGIRRRNAEGVLVAGTASVILTRAIGKRRGTRAPDA